MPSHRFTFSGNRRWTEVHVGVGLLDRLARDLAERDPTPSSIFVLTDSNVAGLHGEPLVQRLADAGLSARLLVFPAGEQHKTRETKSTLEDRLLEEGADRGSLLINVGGGVVCDVGGYLAATWQRGIPTIHVPTSLLAMVDAALGGKTAVNLPRAKNMIGAFHQPQAIYADLDTLQTLPADEFRQGLAETVKCAAIADADLFESLEANPQALLDRDAALLLRVVDRCLEIKGLIVEQDELEQGLRAALNFGHTVGHALEAATDHRLSHGDAVAIGMGVEARLAVIDTVLEEAVVSRLESLLVRLGLPTSLPDEIEIETLIALARRDKKSRGGGLVVAVPVAIGQMAEAGQISRVVEADSLRKALLHHRPPGPH